MRAPCNYALQRYNILWKIEIKSLGEKGETAIFFAQKGAEDV